jgi:hypothetical protein
MLAELTPRDALSVEPELPVGRNPARPLEFMEQLYVVRENLFVFSELHTKYLGGRSDVNKSVMRIVKVFSCMLLVEVTQRARLAEAFQPVRVDDAGVGIRPVDASAGHLALHDFKVVADVLAGEVAVRKSLCEPLGKLDELRHWTEFSASAFWSDVRMRAGVLATLPTLQRDVIVRHVMTRRVGDWNAWIDEAAPLVQHSVSVPRLKANLDDAGLFGVQARRF